VSHAIVENGILEGVGNEPLAHYIVEDLWPIFAGDNLIRHTILDFRF
jgi:hypothetical protein